MNINIKRSPDAAESVDDILGQDYTKTDLSYPLIPESSQNFEIVEITKEPYKDNSGEGLVIKMRTMQENRAAKTNDMLPVGFPATKRIGLTTTEKYSKDMRDKGLAALSQSAGGKPLLPLDSWKGTVVPVKVSIGKDNPQYGQQNEFRFVPPKK